MRIILLAVCCIWLFPGSTDAQNCPSPTLTQGYVVPQQDVYQHGSTVSYSCNPGLKTALETWWGELKCEGGEWSHTPQCIAVSDCFAPEVPHAKPVQALQASYSSSSRVAFACDKGFQFEETDLQEAVCADGQWKLPVCKQKQTACGVPTRVANAVIRHPSQSMFEHTDGVEYQCKHGYKMEGYKYTYCMFSVWTPAPKCASSDDTQKPPDVGPVIPHVKNCDEYPTIEHGDVYTSGKAALTVRCAALYKRVGPERVMCVNGQWSDLPVCKAPCKLDQSRFTYVQKEYMEHSETEVFFCSGIRRVSVKCDDGRAYYKGCQWNDW